MSDMREYYKFYGIYLDDWTSTFGGQTFQRHLVRDWIDRAESEPSSTWVLAGRTFLFPHHIKKKYFLEGVIEGEITFGATAKSWVSNYRVTLFKLNADTVETDLATTGLIIPSNVTITAGDSLSYHYWIDTFNAKEIGEYDRLGVKVEWNINSAKSGSTANIYHDYVSSEYDLWIDVPLILGD